MVEWFWLTMPENYLLILLKSVCGFEGESITNVLDFKREAGLWHGVLTVSKLMHSFNNTT